MEYGVSKVTIVHHGFVIRKKKCVEKQEEGLNSDPSPTMLIEYNGIHLKYVFCRLPHAIV
jgi:hypothetical protein